MDLLQGKLSAPVMEIVTRREGGLFPKPREIHLDCSCPDHADLCKHVAATLYGVGARLDESPELLFRLRGVDHLELIAAATGSLQAELASPASGAAGTLDESNLAEIFGIDLGGGTPAPERKPKAGRPKPPHQPVTKAAKKAIRTGGSSGVQPAKPAKSTKSAAVRKPPTRATRSAARKKAAKVPPRKRDKQRPV